MLLLFTNVCMCMLASRRCITWTWSENVHRLGFWRITEMIYCRMINHQNFVLFQKLQNFKYVKNKISDEACSHSKILYENYVKWTTLLIKMLENYVIWTTFKKKYLCISQNYILKTIDINNYNNKSIYNIGSANCLSTDN